MTAGNPTSSLNGLKIICLISHMSFLQKLTSNRHELVSTSIDDHRFGDGLAIARHKWNFALGATHDRNRLPSVATHSKSVTSNGEQSSKPTLADIMFRFSQESQHERRTSWPNPSQVVNSAPMQKSSTPRRLRVNSIRASAHADRNERKVKLRRAQTAQEASIQGRSLRTLHQITHVEAIAASELERKRQKWLEGEEKRKMEERTCLQRKVDQFIAKVERDKRKQRFGKSKMTSVLEGDR